MTGCLCNLWRCALLCVLLQVSRPYELAQIKFAPPPPPPRPERVLTGACQSVGKRRKSAVCVRMFND